MMLRLVIHVTILISVLIHNVFVKFVVISEHYFFFLFWVGVVKVLEDIIWLSKKVDCVGFLIFWFWLDTD